MTHPGSPTDERAPDAPPASAPSFEDLYEDAPCGHLSMTAEGTIVRVNRTFLAWTGYTAAQLVGTPFSALLTRGGQIFAETRYLPVLRLQGEVKEVAVTMTRADGSALATLVNSVVVRSGPETALIRTAVFDATARQDYERDLLAARREAESSAERVRALQEASAAFVASTSESALADAVVASVRDAFSASAAAVFLVDDAGVPALVSGLQVDGGDRAASGPELEALRTGAVVTLSNRSEVRRHHPAYAEMMTAGRWEAVTATPLSLDGEGAGVVVCFFGRARTFDAETIGLHAALMRQASEALARIRLQRRLERMALFDQLTGLANRQLLQVRLAEALAAAQRSGHATAVLFLDLDGFKEVNDHLGHAAGDTVLRQVADRLRSVIRPNDVAGRFGGDEFVVVCEDADVDAASSVAERLREVIAAPLDGIPAPFAVSASIGVAVHRATDAQPASPDLMFDRADGAMYRSKNAGRNTTTTIVVD